VKVITLVRVIFHRYTIPIFQNRSLSILLTTLIFWLLIFSCSSQISSASVKDLSATPIRSTNLSNSIISAFHPRIAVEDANLYAVWTDMSVGNGDISFAKSQDNGSTFGKTINLSSNSGRSDLANIAANGNDVYVAWQDASYGNFSILFTKSTDGGITFSKPIKLTNNTILAQFPQLVISNNQIYLIWTECIKGAYPDCNELFFTRSLDNGTTFSKPINLSHGVGGAGAAQIFAQDNSIFVVWLAKPMSDAGGNMVYFTKSIDNGETFGNNTILSIDENQSNSCPCSYPSIAASGKDVYALWQSNNNQILFRRSIDEGRSFYNADKLSGSEFIASKPQMNAVHNYIYLIWDEHRPRDSTSNQLIFVRSTDDGATFDRARILSNESVDAQIATWQQGNIVNVVWSDLSNGSADILMTTSYDNGTSLVKPLNISNNLGNSNLAQELIVGNRVYVVWTDNSPSNFSHLDVLFAVVPVHNMIQQRYTMPEFSSSSLPLVASVMVLIILLMLISDKRSKISYK